MEEQSIKKLLIEKYNLKEKVVEYMICIAKFYNYNIEEIVDEYINFTGTKLIHQCRKT